MRDDVHLFSLSSQDEDSDVPESTERGPALPKSPEQESVQPKSRDKTPPSLKTVQKKVAAKNQKVPSRQSSRMPSTSRERSGTSCSWHDSDLNAMDSEEADDSTSYPRRMNSRKSSRSRRDDASVSSKLSNGTTSDDHGRDECPLFKSPRGYAGGRERR